MRNLDERDLEILRLLLADGRRPYSDIAEQVDLSPPAVSDRIDRLHEIGVIRRFTVDLDRTTLSQGTPLILSLDPRPEVASAVYEAIRDEDAVETAYRLADGSVITHVHLPTADAIGWLETVLDLEDLLAIGVEPVVESSDPLSLQIGRFELDCVVCGNPVDDSGELARFDGRVKAFCCESCLARYEQRYERHEQQTD